MPIVSDRRWGGGWCGLNRRSTVSSGYYSHAMLLTKAWIVDRAGKTAIGHQSKQRE